MKGFLNLIFKYLFKLFIGPVKFINNLSDKIINYYNQINYSNTPIFEMKSVYRSRTDRSLNFVIQNNTPNIEFSKRTLEILYYLLVNNNSFKSFGFKKLL